MSSSGEPGDPFPWLAGADTILSKHDHARLMDLPSFLALRRQREPTGRFAHLRKAGLENWGCFFWKMIQEWHQRKRPDRRGPENLEPYKPLLLDKQWALDEAFVILDSISSTVSSHNKSEEGARRCSQEL